MGTGAIETALLAGDVRRVNELVRKAGEEVGRVVGAAPGGEHVVIKTRYGLQGIKLRVELQPKGSRTQVRVFSAGFTYSAQVAASKCAARLMAAIQRVAAKRAGAGGEQCRPEPPELPRIKLPASPSASDVQHEVEAKAYQPKCPECDGVLMFAKTKKQYVCEACMIYVPPCKECARPMRFVEPSQAFQCDQCARAPSRPVGRCT